MYRIDAAERRRRLGVRHALAGPDPVADPAGVTRRMVALHATDPASVYLSLRARLRRAASAGQISEAQISEAQISEAQISEAQISEAQISEAQISEALYDRRDLVRMLAMRRTVFVVPAESVPVVQASTTDRIARDQRGRLVKLLSESGVAVDPQAWLADVERSVLRALTKLGGTATAAELAAAEPRLRTTVTLAAGKPYQAEQAITSRVLLVLSAHGRIVRGRPLGSWLSQQYRWVLAEHWLPAHEQVDEAAARTELARLWLAAFGPAPLADLKWWTGWTMSQARQAVLSLGAVEVDLGERTGLVLPGDLDSTADPGRWVALLPTLDPTIMGWSDRSWFLGPHVKALFDVNGNAGPTVWLAGRVVGGWAQRPDGEVVVRLLEDVGSDAAAQIEAEAGRLGEWLGPARVIPRFRTPTERELSG